MQPNSRFFYWLGQAQYVRRLWNTDNLLVLRLNAQFSADPLFSLEQFVLGGSDSVRGYEENTLLRDNGVFGSAEGRIPVFYVKEHQPLLMVAPFFDLGGGWNTLSGSSKNSGDTQGEVLPSTGIGLILQYKHVNAQIYWGYGFNRKFVHTSN